MSDAEYILGVSDAEYGMAQGFTTPLSPACMLGARLISSRERRARRLGLGRSPERAAQGLGEVVCAALTGRERRSVYGAAQAFGEALSASVRA